MRRPVLCSHRWCLRRVYGEVVGITSQGNRTDGWFCRQHGEERIADNVRRLRVGMWGQYPGRGAGHR